MSKIDEIYQFAEKCHCEQYEDDRIFISVAWLEQLRPYVELAELLINQLDSFGQAKNDLYELHKSDYFNRRDLLIKQIKEANHE